MGPGQCFGELALLNSEGRAANVMALEDSQVGWPVGWLIGWLDDCLEFPVHSDYFPPPRTTL